jgi:hypothetical protein
METHLLTFISRATRARVAFSCAARASPMASVVRTKRRQTAAAYCQGVSCVGFLLRPFSRRERTGWSIPHDRLPSGCQERFRAEDIPDTRRPGYDGLKGDSP